MQAAPWPLSGPRPPGWCHLRLCWPEDTWPAQSPDQNSVPLGCAYTINPTEMRGRRSEEASEDVTARPCWSEWDLALVPQNPLPGMANWLRAWQQLPSSRFPGLQNVAAQWRVSGGAVAGLILAAEARAPAQLGLDDHSGCQDSSFACGQDEPLKQRGRQALDRLVVCGQPAPVKIDGRSPASLTVSGCVGDAELTWGRCPPLALPN